MTFSTQAQSDFPEKFRWKNRLIFLFANSEANDILVKQLKSFQEHQEGIKDRDLKIFIVYPDKIVKYPEQDEISASANSVRKEYKPEGFTYLLIGKDGTEKLRSNEQVSIQKLFSTIDAMPMRRREMRDGNK